MVGGGRWWWWWAVLVIKKRRYTYMPKTWPLGLLQFWRLPALFITILAPSALFFSQFWRLSALLKVPKALFIINFGAEGAVYYQRRFVKTLCIVL